MTEAQTANTTARQRAVTAQRVVCNASGLGLKTTELLRGHARKRISELHHTQVRLRAEYAAKGLCRRCGGEVSRTFPTLCADCAEDMRH